VIQLYLITPCIAFISIDLQPDELNEWVCFRHMPTMHTLLLQFERDRPNKGIRTSKHYPGLPASLFLVYCGQTTVASPVCCCIWMRSLAVSNLCIRWSRCNLGYKAPAERTSSDSTELVHSTPGLKLSFSANPSHRSLPFLLPDWLHGFPGLFTDTSENIRFYSVVFYFVVFLFSTVVVPRCRLIWLM